MRKINMKISIFKVISFFFPHFPLTILENSEYNKMNLNKRRNEDYKQKRMNNISSSNVNNYSNLNLVTENSQKNYEINYNKKSKLNNYNDLEDSLA